MLDIYQWIVPNNFLCLNKEITDFRIYKSNDEQQSFLTELAQIRIQNPCYIWIFRLLSVHCGSWGSLCIHNVYFTCVIIYLQLYFDHYQIVRLHQTCWYFRGNFRIDIAAVIISSVNTWLCFLQYLYLDVLFVRIDLIYCCYTTAMHVCIELNNFASCFLICRYWNSRFGSTILIASLVFALQGWEIENYHHEDN